MMKIWEIDRSVIGKRYKGFSEHGVEWMVNKNKDVARVSNEKLIEEYYSLSTILKMDFYEVGQSEQFSEGEKIKLYEYMVVYNYPTGIGRIKIVQHEKLTSYSDIKKLDTFINEQTGLNVVVVNFKLLRAYMGNI